MIDHQVNGHAVSVCGDDAGDEQQQGPEGDKDPLQKVQEDYTPEHAEAVQNIAEAGAGIADGVEQEDDKAHGDYLHDYLHGKVDQIAGGGGGIGLKKLQGIVIVPVFHMLQVLRQLVLGVLKTQQLGGEESDEYG